MIAIPKLTIEPLPSHVLVEEAKSLNDSGIICQEGDYSFLQVEADYINLLYPKLARHYAVERPRYGAHISLIYPEEASSLRASELGQVHNFSVKGLAKATLDFKEYYILLVLAPTLTSLRQSYNLDPRPMYKANRIDFHITIGVKSL
jgi:hypothetical protein